MPKEIIDYEVELQDAPNDWLCFKWPRGKPEERIGYKVGLHAHGKNCHQCSCPYGEHQKYEPNIPVKTCKHIEMVLDEEFRRARKLNEA